jgi:hypothetical protein
MPEVTPELAPRRSSKPWHNGQAPGPLLRAKEGQTIVIDV